MKSTPEKLAYARAYRAQNREKLRKYFSSEQALEAKRLRRRAYVAKNREKVRALEMAHHLKRYHGLTVEQHRAMWEAQRGLCAICEQEPVGQAHCSKLHVDHDHVTGAIRALLCADCNMGLGKFSDSPARLRKAAMYLERHSAHRHTA